MNRNTTHGDARGNRRTRLYQIWIDMKGRCFNPNSQGYHRYGGRGIKVCPEWKYDYVVFKAWAIGNGYNNGLVIDRINNNEGYFPYNCQWITGGENSVKANKGKISKRRKLTRKDANDIRVSGLKPSKLALVYNVSRAAIYQIIKNKTYLNEVSHDV